MYQVGSIVHYTCYRWSYNNTKALNGRDTVLNKHQSHWFYIFKYAKYRLAIQLHKIYNGNSMDEEWMDMNNQQNFNARNEMFHIVGASRRTVGRNIIANRLSVLNNLIKLDWLNQSLVSFKLKLKELFLTNN